MLSALRRSSLIASIATAVLAAGYTPVMAHQPTMVSTAPRPVRAGKRSLFGGVRASMMSAGRRRASITVAQGKRLVRKARNVARNRRAHR